MGTEDVQKFGGDWTEQKLRILREYMSKYTTILSKYPFRFAYIDAFAGTGYRQKKERDDDPEDLLFPELVDEAQRFLDGSAKIALDCRPSFHRYVFVEKSPKRVADLRMLVDSHPRRESVEIQQRDANEYLRDLSRKDWRKSRALVFVDPYGMQVEWSTLQALGATEAVDVWLLVPISAINRCLKRDGCVSAGLCKRLDRFFGTSDWMDHLYERAEVGQQQLFSDEYSSPDPVTKVSWQAVGDYVHRRLKECFARVPEPGILKRGNSPLFMLAFAAANPRAAAAERIASYLLDRDLERPR